MTEKKMPRRRDLNDPSLGNETALLAVREQLSSLNGAEAQIEGFGIASGRSVDAIG